MSNQYVSALHQVADELKSQLEQCYIEVDAGERMVVWRQEVIGIRP